MRTPEGNIVLKRQGTDEPVCPVCSHNNAMLFRFTSEMERVMECRDCGHTVPEEKVFIWQAESKVNEKTGSRYYALDRSLPWQHECTVCGKRLVNNDGSFLMRGGSRVPYSESTVITSDGLMTCKKCYYDNDEE